MKSATTKERPTLPAPINATARFGRLPAVITSAKKPNKGNVGNNQINSCIYRVSLPLHLTKNINVYGLELAKHLKDQP